MDTSAKPQENSTQPPPKFPQEKPSAERWLEAIVDVSRQIANLEELPTVLQSIITLASKLATADAAAIMLVNHNKSQLTIKCFTAKWPRDGHPAICDTINSSIVTRAIDQGQPLRFPQDRLPDERAWYCPLVDRPVRRASVVPLMLDGTAIGALVALRHDWENFTEDETSGLTHLADQAVIALEHASMTSNIQSIAIVKERYRIAREMHDSLAQVLGYLNIQMQTLEMLLNEGKEQQVRDELAIAKRSIGTAQQDVRESILSLRTTLSDDLPLAIALQEYVIEFGVQTGVDAYFECNTMESPPVTPLANVEIVRIVQEALTNVRKHAQANTVRVELNISPGVLEINIEDDGVGFDTATLRRAHFGLSTMSERAQQIDGKILIIGRPGDGTTVELKVPLTLQVKQ